MDQMHTSAQDYGTVASKRKLDENKQSEVSCNLGALSLTSSSAVAHHSVCSMSTILKKERGTLGAPLQLKAGFNVFDDYSEC